MNAGLGDDARESLDELINRNHRCQTPGFDLPRLVVEVLKGRLWVGCCCGTDRV